MNSGFRGRLRARWYQIEGLEVIAWSQLHYWSPQTPSSRRSAPFILKALAPFILWRRVVGGLSGQFRKQCRDGAAAMADG
jgi:hypothetical protein